MNPIMIDWSIYLALGLAFISRSPLSRKASGSFADGGGNDRRDQVCDWQA